MVIVAPKEVQITGATEARVGDQVELSCKTTPSNPPAHISWSMNGRPLGNSSYKTQTSEQGNKQTNLIPFGQCSFYLIMLFKTFFRRLD